MAATPALTKVFVGNLAFSTTDEELKQAFAPAGNVVSANVISRGRRSLGYAFVSFASEAEAEKAVTLMHHKNIAGREINVEVAKPRAETAGDAPAGEVKPRAPRGGRGGRGARGAQGAQGQDAGAVNGATRGRGRGRGRGGRGRGRGAPRQAQQGQSQENRPLSKTTLFVANLPFSTDDAELNDMFKAFTPTAAHVVRMRNTRSRGYGFVTFADEATQQKALEALHDKEVNSPNGPRKLSVKVAMADNPHENPSASSDAPAQ